MRLPVAQSLALRSGNAGRLDLASMVWFSRLYDRRIVNVNVNIVVAGMLALGMTVAVMHYWEVWGFIDFLDRHLPIRKELIINALTFLVDIIADVAVYYVLHWLANHAPRKTPRIAPRIAQAGLDTMSFVRDATLVQFERAVLSPLLYIVALGTQHIMVANGSGVARATAVGFALGIGLTRVLHTMWMLRNEKRARECNRPDLIASAPWIEAAVRWMMPRQATADVPKKGGKDSAVPKDAPDGTHAAHATHEDLQRDAGAPKAGAGVPRDAAAKAAR